MVLAWLWFYPAWYFPVSDNTLKCCSWGEASCLAVTVCINVDQSYNLNGQASISQQVDVEWTTINFKIFFLYMQFKSAVLNVYKRRCSVHVLVCVIWIQNTIWNIILIGFFYLFTIGLVSFWQKQVRLSYIHIFLLKCIRWPHFPLKGQTCPWCDYLSENIYFGKHLRRDWLH